MTHKGTRNIKTERLILRRLNITDAESLSDAGSLGATQEEAANIIHNILKYYDDDTVYHWAIEYNGTAIGRVKMSDISSRDHFMQIGYDIGYAYRNQGLMTEAVKGVIHFLFHDVGAHRIFGQCRVTNIASIKVLQKSGMVFEGRLRKHFIENDGSYTDVDLYAILNED